MKVALVNVPWSRDGHPELWGVRAGSRWPHFQVREGGARLPRYVPFPFFMAIAASVLSRAGHQVMLIDGVAEGIEKNELYARLKASGPELIFMETSTPSLHHDFGVLERLRLDHPGTVLVCGGTHAPQLVQDLMLHEGVPDYWIAGEYDLALASLVDDLAAGRGPGGVDGVITRKAGFRSLARVEDVDGLPPPLFEHLPMGNYVDPVCGLPAPGAQSWLSRGCPFGCTFCVWPQLVYGSRKYRVRSIAAALDEVERLIRDFRCESFYFDDDTANLGEERMAELAQGIRARGLDRYPWAMMARADCMTPKMVAVLAGAGMYSVKYGVESSAPELRDACGKATNWEKLSSAIRLTKELGIKVHLTFTLGIPGETRESIRQTVAFALEIAPDTAQFSICTPFPGTAFYDECREKGWLVTEDWDRFLGSGEAVISTPSLSAEELHEGFKDAQVAWTVFCRNRLEEKKRRLLERLSEAVGKGRRWRLSGDRDFAEFIWQSGNAGVVAAYAGDGAPADGDLVVIVSRHDEEKLWRRMKRAGDKAAADSLRLYAM